MDALLRWGIENSDHSTHPPNLQERKDLDPGIIDAILGKPDSVLMKEALEVAVDENRDEDDRVQALDDFEMLIEQIDNANNVEKMKMWEPLHGLLTSSSSPDGVKMQTLWIIGTAVQNNPSAQSSYLALSPMPTLLSFLSPDVKSPKIRSKAVYALSGLLKHNARAVRQLEDADGWDILKAALEDSDITVRRKTAFLLNSLLIPTSPPSASAQTPQRAAAAPSAGAQSTAREVILHPTAEAESQRQEPTSSPVHPNSHASMLSDPSTIATSPATVAAFEERGMLQALISALTSPTPHGADGEKEGDADFEEKIVRSLHTYVTSCHGKLSGEQKTELRKYLQEQSAKAGGQAKLAERWSLTINEVEALEKASQ